LRLPVQGASSKAIKVREPKIKTIVARHVLRRAKNHIAIEPPTQVRGEHKTSAGWRAARAATAHAARPLR
jgi:hypothetical protein